jgi:hypothetical protein
LIFEDQKFRWLHFLTENIANLDARRSMAVHAFCGAIAERGSFPRVGAFHGLVSRFKPSQPA